MKILTIGDSWTYGAESSDPATMSWPAQMAKKYDINITNLAQCGSSNKRQIRICFEEVCRNSYYDYVIFPMGPASRTEILKTGKWHQIWPTSPGSSDVDLIFTEYWHPWNDIQNTILDCYSLINTLENLNIKTFITGLSLFPNSYRKELSWITDYNNDNDFEKLGIPLSEFNIGINDLDRKLKVLKAMHNQNLNSQPEYLFDVVENFLNLNETKNIYGKNLFASNNGHPNDQGYASLADYFAKKINLI